MIQDGMWCGKRAFIFGGGPSLRDYNLKLLRNELTIGTNMAWTLDPPPKINLIFDLRVLDASKQYPKFKNYPGVVFYIERPEDPKHYRKYAVPIRAMRGWSHSLQDGLIRGNNCGLSAINLADVLGASPICLLGFDMTPTKKLTDNWHDFYSEDEWKSNAEDTYRNMREEFDKHKDDPKGLVLNLNPDSSLRCFPYFEFSKLFQKAEANV